MPRKLLFSAMKDEAPFLVEWIAYHKAIGFDEVHIAANASNDSTVELLQALEAAGEITFYPNDVAVGERPQGNAAKLFNAAKPWKSRDWVLWLDADEFLNVHLGDGRVDDLIAALKGQDGIFLQWKIMGSSGYVGLPPRMLSQEMVGSSAVDDRVNREIKTMWRASPKFSGFAEVGIHRPHLADGTTTTPDMMLVDGSVMKPDLRVNRNWLDRQDLGASNWASRRPVPWKLAQINHYAVRSRDALKLKARRGRGWDVVPEDGSNDRHTNAFLKNFDLNSTLDSSILRHLPETDAEIARLMALPKVRKLHDAGVEVARNAIADTARVTRPELTLPKKAAALLEAELAKSKAYLEYGSGGSTVRASEMGVPSIFSVESDTAWADMMRRYLLQTKRGMAGTHVFSAYIGTTGDWARPKSEDGWRFYMRYPMSVWDASGFVQPDLVLIDGRFRAGCFLATYLRHEKPVRVLFDDYEDRPGYHVIEALAKPTEMAGRMAAFDLHPDAKDYAKAFALMDVFLDSE